MNDRERRKAFNQERKAVVTEFEELSAATLLMINRILNEAREQIKFLLRISPSDYNLWLLGELESQIKVILNQVSSQSAAAAQSALSNAWSLGELLTDRPLQAAGLTIAGVAPAIDTRQLAALQHVTTRKIDGVTRIMADKIDTQLGMVMMGVQPAGMAITVITNILDEGDRSRALGILRTEISRANSIASDLRKRSAATVLPGMQKQWRRSARKDPRETHTYADGQVQDLDKPFIIGGIEMMHPHDPKAPIGEVINCGCMSLPYMKSWQMSAPGKRAVT
ncbi:hypothetical protein [Pseudohongiella acticola]|uniref:hypothetical protein n=1 Tax=Pseudohongiella acticola TaxID=1524254 RepID=UPI0030ECE7A8